jgi:ABC-type antimicrobial peptide transport system permease subunit
MTIVGVVGDVRQDGLDHAPDMQVYMALNQKAIMGFYRMLARTSGNPMALEQVVRSTFRAVDAGSPVYHVKSLEAYFSARIADRTFALALLVSLGTLALVLAVVGIYGVISYSVSQRIREVGIRMALGAGPRQVLKMLLRHALALIGTGLAFGLGASMILAPLLADLLFAVAPNDPAISLSVALVLGLTALAAALIPAIAAAGADPTVALRSE